MKGIFNEATYRIKVERQLYQMSPLCSVSLLFTQQTATLTRLNAGTGGTEENEDILNPREHTGTHHVPPEH